MLLALFVPLAAAAQTRPRVNVELRNCSELSQPEVRRVLLAELSAHLTEERATDVTRIIVECSGPRAVLRVGDPLSRKVVQRTIDLGASEPKARGRLLALATAELVVASWTELETNPNPKVEPAGPRPPAKVTAAVRQVVQKRARLLSSPRVSSRLPPTELPPEEPAPVREQASPYSERWPDPQNWGIDAPSPDRAFRVMAVASVRSFFNHEGALWGGGLRLAEERFKTVGWSLDALLESGDVTTSDTRFRVTTTTLGAGINLYKRWYKFAIRGGGGVRMGFASTENLDLPEAASSALTPWGWPLASVGLTGFGSRVAAVELLAEAGYVVLPVRGGAPVLRGPWFSVQLAVGVMP